MKYLFIGGMLLTLFWAMGARSYEKMYPESFEKPLVIMYWTTYCVYCKNVIPTLNNIERSGRAYVRGVCLDRYQNPDELREILRKYKPAFPMDSVYRRPGQIFGVPTIFIIKEDRIVKVFYRSVKAGEIERYL